VLTGADAEDDVDIVTAHALAHGDGQLKNFALAGFCGRGIDGGGWRRRAYPADVAKGILHEGARRRAPRGEGAGPPTPERSRRTDTFSANGGWRVLNVGASGKTIEERSDALTRRSTSIQGPEDLPGSDIGLGRRLRTGGLAREKAGG